MKKHIKVYLQGMKIDVCERFCDMHIPCEAQCGRQANSVHHLSSRGMGGSKTKDTIENLIGLCMPCHRAVEDHKIDNEELRAIHLNNIPR